MHPPLTVSLQQYFHTDGADLVGLLCIAKALEGGESDIVSTHHVFNTLQKEHPNVVETLCTPNWYFDRKGEVSEGEDPWYKSSIVRLLLIKLRRSTTDIHAGLPRD